MYAQLGLTSGLIRSPRFDLLFILGCALAALASGAVVVAHPDWFGPILLADVWLLGSQHVIATYTRICFDRETFQQHRFLVLGLPWIVVAGVAGAIYTTGGTLVITTVYLYWQWLHYTSQSYAVHRIYSCKTLPASEWGRRDWLAAWAMYMLPLWGILYRFLQKRMHPNEKFLTFDFYAVPVSAGLVWLVGLAGLALAVAWLAREVRRLAAGQPRSLPHITYVLSHWLVFVASYYLIDDVTYGYLVLNVWHNLQYIMLVWMYNNNRFQRGVDPQAKVLSFISQTQFIWVYLVLSIAAAAIFYKVLAVLDGFLVSNLLPSGALPQLSPDFFRYSGLTKLNLVPQNAAPAAGAAIAMLTYQAVNFHHYCVDALVWSARKRENQQGLGLCPTQAALEALV